MQTKTQAQNKSNPLRVPRGVRAGFESDTPAVEFDAVPRHPRGSNLPCLEPPTPKSYNIIYSDIV